MLRCVFCPGRGSGVGNKVECGKFGAASRNRTHDILITNQALYQLSYGGFCKERILPYLMRVKVGLPPFGGSELSSGELSLAFAFTSS